MATLASVIGRGLLAARPAAGTAGALYYATDGPALYRDNGTTWDSLTLGGMTNPMTTANDLIVGGSSGAPARLAKGSDGQVLTVDPTTHNLVWATPSGGGGTLTYVGKVTAAGGETSLTLPFPSGSGRTLIVKGRLRSAAATLAESAGLILNGDTAGNYILRQTTYGTSAVVTSGHFNSVAAAALGSVPAASEASNYFGSVRAEIVGYQDGQRKIVEATAKEFRSSGPNSVRTESDTQWQNTAAITGLSAMFFGGAAFAAGSEFAVYVERDV